MKVTYSYINALGIEVTKSFTVEASNANLGILEDMYLAEQQIKNAEADKMNSLEAGEDLPF